MNQKADELNLKNSHFVTPHGLDSDEHYTTAYELSLLSNYALKNSKFYQIVRTTNYTVTINGYPKSIHNTNELLGNLNGVYGIKTGFTNGANRCLVTACKRGEMDIICVVLGADTKNWRTKDSMKLIEYCFQNFELVNIKNIIEKSFDNWKEENCQNISIEKGNKQLPTLELGQITFYTVPIDKNKKNNITTDFNCNFNLKAPIHENTSIGTLEIKVDDKIITSCDILIKDNIEKNNINSYIKMFMKNYFHMLNELITI